MKKIVLMFVYFSLCFCCLTGVFGDEVKSVSVMEGDSVTLHSNLTEIQSKDVIEWRFGLQQIRIAEVNKEANRVSIYDDVLDGRFRDRLKLNTQTGDLTILNVTTQHAGIYQLNIRSNRMSTYLFNVTLYARLPVPVISTQNSSSSETSSCVLLCSVLNVRDVSLSWYKGNSSFSSISVSDLNISSISLDLECLDDSYSCVVNNPIRNQTQHLNINHLCQTCSDTTGLTFIHKVVICCVVVGCLMIVASVLIFCICRKHTNTHQQVQSGEEEIIYVETTFHNRRTCKPKAPVEDEVVCAEVMR
ncbi:uncharacterized protein [Misgurnus anguillicaudatus]|uniref:uncharacterized protein n=1 Tax=Misgurnus anguillicaudatus TaxID=75329 RepID=UPI003CCF9010